MMKYLRYWRALFVIILLIIPVLNAFKNWGQWEYIFRISTPQIIATIGGIYPFLYKKTMVGGIGGLSYNEDNSFARICCFVIYLTIYIVMFFI